MYTSELNFFFLPPCLILETSTALHVRPYRRARWALAVLRFAASWAWLLSIKLSVVAIVFAFVAVLAHTADATLVCRTVTSKTALTKRDEAAYVASHASILNFVLDIPGLVLPRLWWHHVLIVCANLIGGTVIIIGGTWMYDYASAWHCYGKSTKLAELNAGYCQTFPGVTSPPRNLCSAGSENPPPGCGAQTIDVFKTIHPVVHAMSHVLLFSATVYIAMIPAKLHTIKSPPPTS